MPHNVYKVKQGLVILLRKLYVVSFDNFELTIIKIIVFCV